MLNPTKLKVYSNAYRIRLQRGEKLSEIDSLYLKSKRLTNEEIEQIHKFMKLI